MAGRVLGRHRAEVQAAGGQRRQPEALQPGAGGHGPGGPRGRYGVYDTAGNGIQASRVSSLTKIDVEALNALMLEAIATESATYALTYAATEGAPVSIPPVFAPIEAKASERSPLAASSPADAAGTS